MFRALLELFITLLAAMVARAVISSIMKGLSNATSNAFQQSQSPPNQQYSGSQPNPPGPKTGSELHKDPVCGTYVSEATGFRRQASGQIYYYCSEDCKNKHSLVAR
jgi:YHS domain-containing protein